MGTFAHIKKCFELADEDILAAIDSRDDTLVLLQRLAKIAEPNTGVAKVLVVFARMGTKACEWFDGDLRVDVRSEGDSCTIEVTAELGMGMRERIFPALAYGVPLEEFTRAIERVPDRIRPLTIRARTAKLVSLGVTEVVRHTSIPPPPVKIAEDSFYTPAALRAARPPTIEVDAPALPVVMPGLPMVSSTLMKAAAKASSKPPKSVRASPPKSVRPPPPKSVRAPPPKSVRPPPPKSVRAPPPKSVRPSQRAAKPPVLERPPLPKPKPRVSPPTPEKRMSVRPPKASAQAPKPPPRPAKPARPSLEERIAKVEAEEEVDSGWEDE